MNTALMFSSGVDEWETPPAVFDPLHAEFGWSLATIYVAVSVNLVLFGLTAPFAAALMDRFGMRRVVAVAVMLVSALLATIRSSSSRFETPPSSRFRK